MNNLLLKIFTAIAYVAMVTVNVLANSLPINNRSTGAISDAYPNLFAPAGITFSIWGLIYLLLGAYVVYQFTKNSQAKEALINKINPLFLATSLANVAWIFAWHYDYIGISVIIMLVLLGLLIKIADLIRVETFTLKERPLICAPFSVYFGWITVATIANITVFLVSLSWNGFGIADYIWTSVILLIGALIGILRMRKDLNVPYGLVLIWAYLGIMLKHVSAGGFGGKYPSIIVTLVICLLLFGFFVAKVFGQKKGELYGTAANG
jgi:hypothetical protein